MTSKGKYFPCSRSLNLEKAKIRTKGGFGMNSPYRESRGGIGWIILLVLLYIIFNPIPGPIDDAAVVAIGGYQSLKRL
jgi:hypothetical protein